MCTIPIHGLDSWLQSILTADNQQTRLIAMHSYVAYPKAETAFLRGDE